MASQTFYAALNSALNGDSAPLASIWSHSSSITTMHPLGGCQVGWDEVRRSWEEAARLITDGRVMLADQLLQVEGDMAYETGIEQGSFTMAGQTVSGFSNRVTNVYRREGGRWKIVHHHVDLSPAMFDALRGGLRA
jgi:ketosteroid isomerase-like protein